MFDKQKISDALEIETLVTYENGGEIRRYKIVDTAASDFEKVFKCCLYFAMQGKKVLITPGFRDDTIGNPIYEKIYASLRGTQYWGKCPDFSVDGVWYEHEGYDVTKDLSEATRRADTFSLMMKRGVKQCARIIVEDCQVARRWARRNIYNRIHFENQNIKEVYIRTRFDLEILYKKGSGAT